MIDYGGRLKAAEWEVKPAPLDVAQEMVARLHYSKGGSNTATDVHGLYRCDDAICQGIAWWLPPTRVAAESVHPDWKRVVALTRLVIEPDVPKNAATFLLAHSVRLLRKEGRWAALVTYADEAMNHTGGIYKASNWTYIGKTGPYPRWVDGNGRQRAPKATKNRTKAEMEALGYKKVGSFHKHKFVMILEEPT